MNQNNHIMALAPMAPDRFPAEVIRGKTYILWASGKFDNYLDAASAGHIVFDAAGNGTARSFTAYDPNQEMAVHQHLTCTTHVDANGETLLKFTVGAGIYAGTLKIKSFNGGEQVWIKSIELNRPLEGWMLHVPAKPRGLR